MNKNLARGILASCLLVGACADPTPIFEQPTVAERTATHDELRELPPPREPMFVAVYRYEDLTGQFEFSDRLQTLSRAVTQGAVAVLIKALQDAGDGRWFRVVEREGLENLLRERQIIRETRALYQPGADGSLPPLLFAGMILEGGITGYDTNTATGGFGARLLGIGGSAEYRIDTVNVHLRAVSISTSEVLIAVDVSKTLFSVGVGADVFRFVSSDQILEIDAGLTQNEPEFVATKQAIEKAVIALVLAGVERGVFAFAEETAETRALLEAHRRERGEPVTEHAGLTAPPAGSDGAGADRGPAGGNGPAVAGTPVAADAPDPAAANPAAANPGVDGGAADRRRTAERISGPETAPDAAAPRPMIRVRSGQHPTFARLVFDRPEPFAYAIIRDGATVQVRFDAPADADLRRVRPQHLRTVSDVATAAAAENLTVTLEIDPRATVRHLALDHRVVVDLIPARYQALPLWNADLLPPEPDTPGEALASDRAEDGPDARDEAEPAAASDPGPARPVVRVRSGRHATFSRLVFDRPEAFAYAVEREGAMVRVRFEAPADADLSRVRPNGLRALSGIDAIPDAEDLTVSLDIDPRATVRYVALDHRVVVDLIPAGYQALPLWDSELLPPQPDEPADVVAEDGQETVSAVPDRTNPAAAPDPGASSPVVLRQ